MGPGFDLVKMIFGRGGGGMNHLGNFLMLIPSDDRKTNYLNLCNDVFGTHLSIAYMQLARTCQ